MPFIFSVSDDYTLRLWTHNHTEVLYEDLTAVKSNRKISDMYKLDFKNKFIELNYNLIESENSQNSNHSNSGDDVDSEISN